ncbi:DUF4269 domain-containing protein [Maricaulis sp. CAU 1757]
MPRARELFVESGIHHSLAGHDPRWVGSIPLDVHGPGADIDICCTGGSDLARFAATLDKALGRFGARAVHNLHAGEASIISRFEIGGVAFEVFGRARPVETHEAWVHWKAEDRLLSLAGEALRADVRAAKRSGLKTEPAFAQCLGLGGDPYVELLKLAAAGDEALRGLLARAGYAGPGSSPRRSQPVTE